MSSLKKRSATALAWDMGGTIMRQGSGFIISIFLARLLEPAEFGLVGMAMVFISISQVFIDVGFSSALIQNKANTNLTYSSVFYLNVFAGFVLTAIFYFAAPLVGAFYESNQITELVQWLSLIFVFNSLNLVQQAILQRELNFKILTLRTVIASAIGGVLGVIFAFLGYGVYALVIQQISTGVLSTILLWTTSKWKPDFNFSLIEVKKLTAFSSFVFFDRFISTIFQRIDILMIGKVFSPATLGFYTRAMSLQQLVTTYSSGSLTKIFYPVLSKLQDDVSEYARVYFKVISVISFTSFLLTGMLYVMGEDIIIILFGQKWYPSVPIFQILIIGVCTYPLNSMMVNAFMSKGKSRENFIIGIFRKLVRVIPLLIAYFYGIYEFTIGVVITYYFLTATNIYFLNKYTGLEIKKHFRKIFEGILPLIIIIFLYQLPYFDNLLKRALLCVLYIVGYLLYSHIIKSEGFLFIISNFKSKFYAK
ncbi:lipopolysaccharide biosynthesis protein [Marivirga tractuosa]|uniref:lipopolysaccharide biosynthesis protein n=1 Tax=Marivirga tractuosa TaxID=1006 RepID=UPI0035CFAD44